MIKQLVQFSKKFTSEVTDVNFLHYSNNNTTHINVYIL